MENNCQWTLAGTLSQATYKTVGSGRGFWLLHVRVEKGEITLYVHEPELQRVAEELTLGTPIFATGKILPHSRVSQAERPYFLSPTSLVTQSP
jgi:hypothetical protein